MRVINLNGYIDEDVWYGDEITPDMLHEQLFTEDEDHQQPVRIILNSYGGSCNAAVRMYDDVRAYPGDVHIIISGTAASADFLCDDQVNLSVETILKKPGPFSGVFHVGSSLAFIHIKVHKRPVRTERDGVDVLLLMKEQVVLISGLIEKADVDSDPIMCIGTGIFMLQAFEP